MPTRPDFHRHHEPEPEHDVERLLAGFETEAQAERYRRVRVGILRKGGEADRGLADRLERCGGPDGWCLSPACPSCARSYRRWLVGEALRLLEPRDGLLFVTVLMPERRARSGRLDEVDARAAMSALKRQIERGLPGAVAIGGLDVGMEVDRRGGRSDRWQPHAHMVVCGCTAEEARRALGRHYPRTAAVARPTVIKPIGRDEDRARLLSYCRKGLHHRYVSDVDGEGKPTRRRYPLRDGEWREVLRFVDGLAFGELTLLRGVRRHGAELRFTSKPVAEKTTPSARRRAPGGERSGEAARGGR